MGKWNVKVGKITYDHTIEIATSSQKSLASGSRGATDSYQS